MSKNMASNDVNSSQEPILVVNELLSYVFQYFDCSTAENLKNVVIDFYHPDEISKGKQLLWEYYNKYLPTIEHRRNTPSRPAHAAEAADIIQAMQKIDGCTDGPVQFVAMNLDRVPGAHGPEECDMMSMVSRIGKSENNISKIEKNTAKNADSINALFELVYEMRHNMSRQKDDNTDFPPLSVCPRSAS